MLTWENGSTIDRVGKDEQGWIFGGVKGEKIEWEMECCQDRKGVRISKRDQSSRERETFKAIKDVNEWEIVRAKK